MPAVGFAGLRQSFDQLVGEVEVVAAVTTV
mgnify:CR=1 FL=1